MPENLKSIRVLAVQCPKHQPGHTAEKQAAHPSVKGLARALSPRYPALSVAVTKGTAWAVRMRRISADSEIAALEVEAANHFAGRLNPSPR